MSVTGAGEALTSLQDYIDDYNEYKDNLTQVGTQYQNLYNVITSKIEYANELKQRFYFLYFSTSGLAIDAAGVNEVIAQIKAFESPDSKDDVTINTVGLWEGFWTSVCSIGELGVLSYAFSSYTKLKVKYKAKATSDLTMLEKTLTIDEVVDEKFSKLANADVTEVSIGSNASGMDITTNVAEQQDLLTSSIELTTNATSDVTVANKAGDEIKIPTSDAVQTGIMESTEETVEKCVNFKIGAALSASVAIVIWAVGDLIAGAVEASEEESDIEDKISDLESDFKLLAEGIASLESLHTNICDYIELLTSTINSLTSALSSASISVTYFDSNNDWATLSDWSATTSDGEASSDETTLTFSANEVDFTYTDDDGTTHKNEDYSYTEYQDGWSWSQTKSDSSPSMYSSYLSFADRACEAFQFLATIKIWQTSYLASNPDATLTAIDTSDSSADKDGSSNTEFTAFKADSVLLSADVGGQTVTDDMYIAAWNATIDYDYEVEEVTS